MNEMLKIKIKNIAYQNICEIYECQCRHQFISKDKLILHQQQSPKCVNGRTLEVNICDHQPYRTLLKPNIGRNNNMNAKRDTIKISEHKPEQSELHIDNENNNNVEIN